MTLRDFRDLIDRYGGDPSRWPPEAGQAAARLLASAPEARSALAAMRAAEAAYLGVRPPPSMRDFASAAFVAPAPRDLSVPTGRWAAAAAVVLAVGVALGAAIPKPDEAASAVLSALNAPGEASDAE